MIPFRRALVMAAVLLFMIFFLYPRQQQDPMMKQRQSPVESKTAVGSDKLAKAQAPTTKSTAVDDKPPAAAKAEPGSVKTQQKLAIANIQNLPVSQQLAHHFPYDVSSKFPAYIWQTWKYTPSDPLFAEKFRAMEASWTERHPTFVHEVITDQVALHLTKHLYSAVPDVLEAYLSMPVPILKADFFRYLILLARGGIYADIDTFALKPVTEWVSQTFDLKSIGLVIGIEADPDRPDWAEWYSRRIQFCQWTIQAKPGHPVLRDIVSNITIETLKRKREGKLKSNHKNVVEWTGPAVWTDSVFSYFNDPEYFDMSSSQGNITFANFTGISEGKKVGDVIVLPITSFSPGIGHSGAGPIEDPMAFVKHEFEGSWKPESERVIEPKEEEKEEGK